MAQFNYSAVETALYLWTAANQEASHSNRYFNLAKLCLNKRRQLELLQWAMLADDNFIQLHRRYSQYRLFMFSVDVRELDEAISNIIAHAYAEQYMTLNNYR